MPNIHASIIEGVRDYCREAGTSPYIWVDVDNACEVPQDFVRDGMIVLDLSDEAIHNYAVNDHWMTFQARFGEDNAISTLKIPLNRIALVASAEAPEQGAMLQVTETPAEVVAEMCGGSAVSAQPASSQPAAFRRPMRVK